MRLILSVTVVALISVTVLGVGGVAERNARRTLTSELETRLLFEARHLALLSDDALLADYPELTLCPLVTRMQNRRDDLAFVAVLDHAGLVQGHIDVRRLGAPLGGLDALTPVPSSLPLESGESLRADRQMLVASVPVTRGGQRPLGTALVGLRRAYLDRMVTRSRQELLLVTVALLMAGVGIAILLMGHLLRPVGELKQGLERIGRGDLDTPLRVHGRTELGLLADAVNGMSARLKASQSELVEKERLAHEMDLARSIQESLMPGAQTVARDFVVAGRYQAATEVGGDFYDVFPLAGGRIGMAVADVAGKGLGGCLVTSMLAVLLRSLRDQHASPVELLVALEAHLRGSLRPGVFVTMFYGVLDPAEGRLTWASAAHSPLLIHRAATGQAEWHRTRGIPLGAIARPGALRDSLTDETVVLEPGDLALQFTDGLSEACGGKGCEEFGFARVEDVVARKAGEDAQGVLEALRSAVIAWTAGGPPGDDLTLLVMKRQPAAAPAVAVPPADLVGRLSRLSSRAQLPRALAGAAHLALPSSARELAHLRAWLASCPRLSELTTAERHMAESGLYEICANIVEHGYDDMAGAAIDLWWVPASGPPDDPGAGGRQAGDLGHFVVLDDGRAFDLTGWRPSDLRDPDVRRQGRGLGLHIVHSAMRRVEYLPATPIGNVTVLAFTPRLLDAREEISHV